MLGYFQLDAHLRCPPLQRVVIAIRLLELYDYLPGISYSRALGNYRRMVGQSKMHDPAFVRRHWLQCDSAPRILYTTGYTVRHIRKRLVPSFLVAFYVYHHIDPLTDLVAHDVLDHELNRVERLTLAAYQQTGVVSFDLEDRAVERLVIHLLERESRVHTHH